MNDARSTLVLAWGNPVRGDDGLGPAFADALARRAPRGVVFEVVEHPAVEHAALVAGFDRVLLVDADASAPAPFRLAPIAPEAVGVGISTHGLDPRALLALARDLYGAVPEAWLLGIRGEVFDRFVEALSSRARAGLDAAVAHVALGLATDHLIAFPRSPESAPAAEEVQACPTDRT